MTIHFKLEERKKKNRKERHKYCRGSKKGGWGGVGRREKEKEVKRSRTPVEFKWLLSHHTPP